MLDSVRDMLSDSSVALVLCVWFLRLMGVFDIIRGIMHTFAVNQSAVWFAKLDLRTNKNDQLWLLGVFGLSNFLTGFVFLLVATEAQNIAPHIIGLVPLAYGVGLIGLKNVAGIRPQSKFNGKYFMRIYLSICVLLSVTYFIGF